MQKFFLEVPQGMTDKQKKEKKKTNSVTIKWPVHAARDKREEFHFSCREELKREYSASMWSLRCS